MTDYPKWRHHPEEESMIVYNEDQEVSQTPDEQGWRDDRNFQDDEEVPRKRGRKSKMTV